MYKASINFSGSRPLTISTTSPISSPPRTRPSLPGSPPRADPGRRQPLPQTVVSCQWPCIWPSYVCTHASGFSWSITPRKGQETIAFLPEQELGFPGRAIPMLGNNNFREALPIRHIVVVIVPVDEHHHVRRLLNLTG